MAAWASRTERTKNTTHVPKASSSPPTSREQALTLTLTLTLTLALALTLTLTLALNLNLTLTLTLTLALTLPQLARLPCLETLWLHDNPLARREGYWARCAAAFAEARGGGAPSARGGGGGGGGGGVGAGAARAPPMEKVFVDGVLVTHPVLALT